MGKVEVKRRFCFSQDLSQPEHRPEMGVRYDADGMLKTVFLEPFYVYKRSFYQDRLGTNIGKPQKQTVFSCRAVLRQCRRLRVRLRLL